MIKECLQRPMPSRLSHHTSFDSLKGILSNQEGKGICFHAVSNMYKNDKEEISMGEYILKYVRDVFHTESILHKIGGYRESASVSFMEGESTPYMINRYGKYRLDFDFRKYEKIGNVFSKGFLNCEYVDEKDLSDYADSYARKLIDYHELAKDNKGFAVDYIFMVNDLICKIFTIKEKKWSNEKEWRKTILLNKSESKIFIDCNNRPYKKVFFSKQSLKSIVVFRTKEECILNAILDWWKVRLFLFVKGYFRVSVKIITYVEDKSFDIH